MEEAVRLLEWSPIDPKVDAAVERFPHGKDAGLLADVLEAVDDSGHVEGLFRAQCPIGRAHHQIITGAGPDIRVGRHARRDPLEGFAEQGSLAALAAAGHAATPTAAATTRGFSC